MGSVLGEGISISVFTIHNPKKALKSLKCLSDK